MGNDTITTDEMAALRSLLDRSIDEVSQLEARARARSHRRLRSLRDALRARVGHRVDLALLNGERRRGVIQDVGIDHVELDRGDHVDLIALFPITIISSADDCPNDGCDASDCVMR